MRTSNLYFNFWFDQYYYEIFNCPSSHISNFPLMSLSSSQSLFLNLGWADEFLRQTQKMHLAASTLLCLHTGAGTLMQELWPLSRCCKVASSFPLQDGEYQASSWDASLLHCDVQSSCLKQSQNLNSSVIIKGKDENKVPLKYCEDLIYDGAGAAPSTLFALSVGCFVLFSAYCCVKSLNKQLS